MGAKMGNWIVSKFGGTSVSTKENWQKIASIVKNHVSNGFNVIIVHSALSGVTNLLEQIIINPSDYKSIIDLIYNKHKNLALDLKIDPNINNNLFEQLISLSTGVNLLKEASYKIQAKILSFGELLSTRLGYEYLKTCGIDIKWIDVRELLTSSEIINQSEPNKYLSAQCDFEYDEKLCKFLNSESKVVITQGFIAKNIKGETVILGRGGSDTSASYLASKIKASRLEIWTDVPGMFTTNPQIISEARLIKYLDYDEAQEIASSGAKVLHPRCIPPAKYSKIPIWVMSTFNPELPGTIISEKTSFYPHVKAISIKKGITLVSMETLSMWHQYGFLADIFTCFKDLGLSIDLISTSESSVTVSLDNQVNILTDSVLNNLRNLLSNFCNVKIINSSASISIVGKHIRSILHILGNCFEFFEEHKMHMLSLAENDLNLSFVVDEKDVEKIARLLHNQLIYSQNDIFGQTWYELNNFQNIINNDFKPWWLKERELLLTYKDRTPLYIYKKSVIQEKLIQLKNMKSIDKIFYSIKANPNKEVIKFLEKLGFNFECVSIDEVRYLLNLFNNIDRSRLLFTPNFVEKSEYQEAFDNNILVTIDNIYPLLKWKEIFANKSIFIRVDIGTGLGHHRKVKTGGNLSKFGIPLDELNNLKSLTNQINLKIIGLHCHIGSGIMDESVWIKIAKNLLLIASSFKDIKYIDLGGGFGVPEKQNEPHLDLFKIDSMLSDLKKSYPSYSFWIEPGRFVISEAGILLVKVTQIKLKKDIKYVGVNTGINSLIRPALYGSYHEIYNISNNSNNFEQVTVVGPICESGDILGYDRLLNECREDDLLIIANCGAYGRSMSSYYNLREPAKEIIIE